jgi:hypothetical protein
LAVDALFCHGGKTIGEKTAAPWAHYRMQVAGARRWTANHRSRKFPCALFDRFKDVRRCVVGVDINRHGVIRKLAWRRRHRVPTA